MHGNSSRAAPAPASSCRVARRARSSRSDALRRDHHNTEERRETMTTAIAPDMSAVPLRYSAPIGGVAGTSFKPEHLPAILKAGPQRGFFEVHAENYMGAGGPPHRALGADRRGPPLLLHGVCMLIGGAAPPPTT